MLTIGLTVFVLFSPFVACDDPPVFVGSGVSSKKGCVDLDPKCSVWASSGECQSNAAWMMANCRRSCNSCQGGDKAWTLRNKIAKKYDNKTLTGKKNVGNVDVKTLRLDHLEIDEKKQIMTVHGRLVMAWNDSRLTWDKKEYGVSWLNFYWLQIWAPKIIQTNSPKVSSGKVESKVLAANYTGQAFMWADFTFSAPCLFDYSSYPVDKQTCCFKFDDQRYYSVRFHVTEKAKKATTNSALTTHISGWKVADAILTESKYIIKILSDWSRDPFDLETTNCEICVTVSRNAAYYNAEIVGPAVATAIITVTSFMVGSFWNQILLLITSLGFQLFSISILNSKLPPMAGTLPKIVHFYSFNLTLTLILLVLTCILLNLVGMTSTLPPPHCFDKLLELLQKAMPCLKMDTDERKFGDPTLESSESATKAYWAPVTKVIKFILFVVTIMLYVFLMLAFLTV